VANPSPRTSLKATAPEFQLLGLRPREARLEVIRRALTETAGDVKASEHWAAEDCTVGKVLQQEDGRLAQVAVAGYRLLDPRRRRTLFERVQLLLWSDEESDVSSAPVWDVPPLDAAPLQKQVPASATEAGPVAVSAGAQSRVETRLVSTTRMAEETQAALDVIRSLRSRDRRATALWISVAALAISLPGAVGLVLALI